MNIGDKAPELLGTDQDGKEIKLSDYKGKKIVLYFYPKDLRPVAHRRLAAFATTTS